MAGQAREELLARLAKVLQLEKREGYQDRAVLGGLEGFIERAAAELEPADAELAAALRAQAQGYAAMPFMKRREAIRELEDLLRAVEVGVVSPKARKAKGGLGSPVRYAKGVGERREKLLNKLGIEKIEDLLLYFPRRIEDRSQIKRIASLRHGERATIHGRVSAIDTIRPRRDLEILKVAVQDISGVAYAVWFNQPWLKKQFAVGMKLALFGEVERAFGAVQLTNPVWEPAGENFLTGRLVPVYPATEGLPQGALLRLIRENLALYQDEIEELIPEEVRLRLGLLPRREAFFKIHFPESLEEFELARRSLAFEELFLFQIGVALERRRVRDRPGRSLTISDEQLEEFIAALPFRLTAAQGRALAEIREDLAAPRPMHRLLQGDVGSGKTVLALIACLIAHASGYQAAMMAPTEILAEQHYRVITDLVERARLPLRVGLLIGSLPEREKAAMREGIERGEVDLVLGTHALIQDEVRFRRLGLAVIDEQHRFGVIQRAELEKKGQELDVLVMSATPIPRTITLILYGQFEISILDELPYERRIKTYWVAEERREEVYQLIKGRLAKGEQTFIIYPLIEEPEEEARLLDLRAATEMAEELARGPFREFKVGLLHGRVSDAEKRAVLEAFRRKELHVLVATTIVEVGIDVPDASIMIIEHADRFGLAQLHQLRGRIGRAGQEALCFALASPKTEEARRRLEAFRDTDDGFKIAEQDLLIRGPGELLGPAQHGLDTTFKAADLLRDLELLKLAREEALKLIEAEPDHPLVAEFSRRFGGRFEWARF
ncbi:MAG: ATP-dependent DNA helicase RecG [Candidatus Acetothermia bacterium]|jgi:ATP-dependent DNA helicase RecG|nr:ATP-dependent DNA helicase RecG [Candidatus Acetothermia bacterium]MDH7505657.1 ATP-dependent DNA helicase RecG [Candidatus Acetothermia bacterium]